MTWYADHEFEGRCPVCGFEAGNELEAEVHDAHYANHYGRDEFARVARSLGWVKWLQ